MANRGNRRTAVLFGAVLIAGVGLLLIGQSSFGGDPAPAENRSFVIRNLGPQFNSLLQGGIESGNVSLPNRTTLLSSDGPDPAELIAAKRAEAGLLSLPQAAEARNLSDDVRILPYYLYLPPNITGIYTPRDSGITEIADLRNRAVTSPDKPISVTMTLIALTQQGGLNRDDITIRRYPYTFQTGGSRPAGAAHYITGYPDPDRMRPVASPGEYLKDLHGATPPLNVIVISEPEHYDFGEEMALTLKSSSRFAIRNTESLPASNRSRLTAHVIDAARNRDGTLIQEIGGDETRAGQHVLDFMAENNLTVSISLPEALIYSAP